LASIDLVSCTGMTLPGAIFRLPPGAGAFMPGFAAGALDGVCPAASGVLVDCAARGAARTPLKNNAVVHLRIIMPNLLVA
jgi:hypothetical protein